MPNTTSVVGTMTHNVSDASVNIDIPFIIINKRHAKKKGLAVQDYVMRYLKLCAICR